MKKVLRVGIYSFMFKKIQLNINFVVFFVFFKS
jgi:hypothetical protein